MRTSIGTLVLIGFLALAPALSPSLVRAEGHEEHSLEHAVVEMATTPAAHAALAEHYRAKAAEARADATQHDKMASSYRLQKHGAADQMAQHCSKIAASDRAAAAEYDSLANLHDAESKKAK